VTAKSIARSGDVSAQAGSSMYTGATSGSWTAGDLTLTTASLASSGGSKAVIKATCTFSFSGSNGQSAVTGTSSVTLNPSSRLLTIGGTAPLVDGDSAKDDYGNTIKVSSSTLWKTS